MEKDKYIALIISDLNGSISDADAQVLENWRKADAENELLFQETLSFWKESANYKTDIKVDTNKAWNKISAEIKSEPKKIAIFSTYKKIAAAVIILLTTGFFLNNFLNTSTTILTAENETKEIILPDGSSIVLNENSKIQYAKNFSDRKVTLEGEAFFDVTKQDGKNFTVFSDITETVVLGTSFNIDASENNKVALALYTGKVKFTASNLSKELVPGEIVVFDKNKSTLVKEKTEIENKIAWKTKTLQFSNTNLKTVINELEDYYDVVIHYNQEDVSKCQFSGKFSNTPVVEVLEAIGFSFGTEYAEKAGIYSFGAFNCEQ